MNWSSKGIDRLGVAGDASACLFPFPFFWRSVEPIRPTSRFFFRIPRPGLYRTTRCVASLYAHDLDAQSMRPPPQHPSHHQMPLKFIIDGRPRCVFRQLGVGGSLSIGHRSFWVFSFFSLQLRFGPQILRGGTVKDGPSRQPVQPWTHTPWTRRRRALSAQQPAQHGMHLMRTFWGESTAALVPL